MFRKNNKLQFGMRFISYLLPTCYLAASLPSYSQNYHWSDQYGSRQQQQYNYKNNAEIKKNDQMIYNHYLNKNDPASTNYHIILKKDHLCENIRGRFVCY